MKSGTSRTISVKRIFVTQVRVMMRCEKRFKIRKLLNEIEEKRSGFYDVKLM